MMIAEALFCLALNVYHEAKNQSMIGQIAVAQVVMNRVYDERYPNTICEVVEQGPTYSWKPDFPVRNRCQFSWYCDGKSDTPRDLDAWEKAIAAVDKTYDRTSETDTKAQTQFTNDMTNYQNQLQSINNKQEKPTPSHKS